MGLSSSHTHMFTLTTPTRRRHHYIHIDPIERSRPVFNCTIAILQDCCSYTFVRVRYIKHKRKWENTPSKEKTTMTESKPSIERDAKGIPLKSPYPEGTSVTLLYSVMTIIITAIGTAIAYFSSYFTESNIEIANSKIAIISQYDLGWLYLGIFLVGKLTLPIQISLGSARKASKAGLPDQHVYKVMGTSEGSSKLGYVLMENDGVHGAFNRAQRALQNYHENFPGVVVQYLAASFVFPRNAFICMMIWQISSCIGAVGYKNDVKGRMKGRLPSYFALSTLSGMVLIVALKSLL